MNPENKIKKKILRQIDKIPENRLSEVLQFLNEIRPNNQEKNVILSYAGIWSDMSDDEFKDLTDNVSNRRKSRENRF